MKEWHSHTDSIELKDGTKIKEYTYVFQTTEHELADKIEKFFKDVMDNKTGETE